MKARIDPSYELMDDHEGRSLIYREHGFPSPLVRWHNHKEYELHLIVASSGKVFIGDYIGNFRPDTLFLTGPNLPHNWISQLRPGEHIEKRDMLVNFTEDTFEGAGQSFQELRTLQPMFTRAAYGIEYRCRKTLREARALMQRISETDNLARLGYLLVLLEMLAASDEQYQLSGSTASQLMGDDRHADRTNQAVNYIFSRYMRELSLEEVAAHMGMKPTYFSRFFKQATGRCFVEFVNSLRISKSCELLVGSHLPVTEVCFESGFNNLSNFNRRFQQLKGMTPSHYRRLAGQRFAEHGADRA
jgi:AraC-like DNA-binding protein